MPRKIRILLLPAVVILALASVLLIFFTAGRPAATPPPPNPNGYDDFLKAAALLTGDVGNASTLDHDSLQALMSTNAEPLRLMRLGLSHNCSVLTDSARTNISNVLADLANLKSLARLLAEEGRLAEMEGRYADAAQDYADVIRFGNEISRGGFIINRLVGIACEAIGDTPLSKLAPKLSPDEARRVAGELEKLDSTGITWDEVRRNERKLVSYQLRQRMFNPFAWAMSRWQNWQSVKRAEMRNNRLAAHLRLLTTELALRSYQAEQGRIPAGLEQLVPKYLQHVPSDPFSGKPMIYRPQGTNWLLYSIGEDGVDDGGKPVGRSGPRSVTRGDIFYDSPY